MRAERSQPPLILLADANTRNLNILSSFLTDSGYRTSTVHSLSGLGAIVDDAEQAEQIALAFVDLQGFDAKVWDQLRAVHESGIPFIVMARPRTKFSQTDLKRRSEDAGARHTLTKPLRKEQVLTLVRILTHFDDDV